MTEPKPITSAANPHMKAAVKLRRSRDRRKSGLFLAEGPREVGRAVEADLELVEVYFCPDLLSGDQLTQLLDGLGADVPVMSLPETLLKMLAYRDEPEGVIAVVRQPVWTLEDISAGQRGGQGEALYLVAVGTSKPGNLGAMARSAEAAGCTAILASGTPVDVFNPNAIRASTCAVYTLPVVNVEEAQAIRFLRDHQITIAAATPDTRMSQCYTDTDLTGPMALVIGPEDTGLSETWLSTADRCLTIPTLGSTVDSLNASNAAAVLLFEAVRQRGRSD